MERGNLRAKPALPCEAWPDLEVRQVAVLLASSAACALAVACAQVVCAVAHGDDVGLENVEAAALQRCPGRPGRGS